MSYAVRIVRSRRTMRDFLKLPRKIYRGNECYVEPLRSEVRRTLDPAHNPYFRGVQLQLFVCYADGSPVARVAILINPRHEAKFGVRAAFFGFFESIDDAQATESLFSAAMRYCRDHGATLLEGPFNPNHYSELGILLDHYDRPPAFFQTYNPPYYPALLEGAGFRVTARLFTARNDRIAEYIDARKGSYTALPVPDGYAVRHPDMRHLREEMERIRLVFNDAFASNWHFLPASREEYDFSAKFITMITDPSLITIIEHRGEPVAVLMCVLDVNPLLRSFRGRTGPMKLLRFLRGRRHVRNVIVYAGGIRRRYQHTRVYALLYDECARILRRFESAECTWMSDGNMLARRSSERFDMKPDKHFAIYGMSLTTGRNFGPISDKPLTAKADNSHILPLPTTIEAQHG